MIKYNYLYYTLLLEYITSTPMLTLRTILDNASLLQLFPKYLSSCHKSLISLPAGAVFYGT